MQTKYTFANLVNDQTIRASFFRDYDKLITNLKALGYYSVAIKHAKNKKRIAAELEEID
ncbi:hypothetical protein [Endobacterium cereale]|uniref:hypothetical protein n=1 Tax=Endobacterium cereale TaxID=2663029 RepID=UPI002B49A179|nr:hypothetical protein [Endobacterium cereale]MEB2843783.1 hypothetical protein [Endobacterium cereale]